MPVHGNGVESGDVKYTVQQWKKEEREKEVQSAVEWLVVVGAVPPTRALFLLSPEYSGWTNAHSRRQDDHILRKGGAQRISLWLLLGHFMEVSACKMIFCLNYYATPA